MRIFACDACIAAWGFAEGVGDESVDDDAASFFNLWVDIGGFAAGERPPVTAAGVVGGTDSGVVCANHCVWGGAEPASGAVCMVGAGGDALVRICVS